MDFKKEVELAYARIRPYIRETFLQFSPYFSERAGTRVFLKLEQLQHTGSFKARGAFNKILSLSEEERNGGIVAASSGNHGAGVAYVMQQLKLKGIIFVPETASKAKISNIKRFGATVKLCGLDIEDAQIEALAYAKKHAMAYVSPYNDYTIVFGQGTLGLELHTQLPKMDAVFVAVGGGGLIAGVGGYLKSVDPSIRIIGCSPKMSGVMAETWRTGEMPPHTAHPTLSDGTGGRIVPHAITIELCQKYVDEFCLISEAEIKTMIRDIIEQERFLVEGAGAVAVAGLLHYCRKLKNAGQLNRDGSFVAVLSGGNISLSTLQTVCCGK